MSSREQLGSMGTTVTGSMRAACFAWAAAVTCVSCFAAATNTTGQDDKRLDVSTLLRDFQVGYDRRVRPNYGGEPVSVGVSLYVLSVGEISAKFMDFTFDMYFRQFWVDDRLKFKKKNGIAKLVVGADYIKLIWVPDTFFVNEKTAQFHAATQDNQFLRITHQGEILRSMRLTVKATCPMDLSHFPMDSQLCTLEIESYGYAMADLVYFWNDGVKSVEVSPDVSLAEFHVVGYRQRRVLEVLTSGNYSRLCADILFGRSMGYYVIQVCTMGYYVIQVCTMGYYVIKVCTVGYYVIQVYVPSSLIVVMSWVSFYLDRSSAPARVGLGVTTVLTMVTLMGSVNRSLPKISYMKALDIYLAVCFFMVFGALLEYATVSYTGKRIKLNQRRFEEFKKKVEEMKAQLDKQREKEVHLLNMEQMKPPYWDTRHADFCPVKALQNQLYYLDRAPLTPPMAAAANPPTTLWGVRASDIERYARIAFPLIFFSFHLMYWTILISISGHTVEDLIAVKS